jgi:hypothetical protein
MLACLPSLTSLTLYWEVPRTTPRIPLPFPRTTLGHRAGYPQSHCAAELLGKGQPIIGVVCGSDNPMFGAIQNSDRMARLAMSPIEGEDTRHN